MRVGVTCKAVQAWPCAGLTACMELSLNTISGSSACIADFERCSLYTCFAAAAAAVAEAAAAKAAAAAAKYGFAWAVQLVPVTWHASGCAEFASLQ